MLDRQTTKEKIMQLITRCTQLINVQHNMNAMQIEFCAEQILDKMYYYSLEDIQLCLDRGGRIGDSGRCGSGVQRHAHGVRPPAVFAGQRW